MHQLIKYFKKEEYAKMFLQGKLYMNSLSYFWNNGFEDQRDMFEGISATFDKKALGLPIHWQQIINGDIMFRLDAYKFCNLYCFYRVDIEENLSIANFLNKSTYSLINLPDLSMQQFGDTVAIVKNEDELIKRVIAALQKEWVCIAGDVRYHKINGNKNGLIGDSFWQSDKKFPAPKLKNGITSTKDCFIKSTIYSIQKEWRICLFRNKKLETPLILDVGDLSDIVELVPAKMIQQKLIQMYMPCFPSDVIPQLSCFKGNIRRSEFKEKMYTFDNALGHFIMTM